MLEAFGIILFLISCVIIALDEYHLFGFKMNKTIKVIVSLTSAVSIVIEFVVFFDDIIAFIGKIF